MDIPAAMQAALPSVIGMFRLGRLEREFGYVFRPLDPCYEPQFASAPSSLNVTFHKEKLC